MAHHSNPTCTLPRRGEGSTFSEEAVSKSLLRGSAFPTAAQLSSARRGLLQSRRERLARGGEAANDAVERSVVAGASAYSPDTKHMQQHSEQLPPGQNMEHGGAVVEGLGTPGVVHHLASLRQAQSTRRSACRSACRSTDSAVDSTARHLIFSKVGGSPVRARHHQSTRPAASPTRPIGSARVGSARVGSARVGSARFGGADASAGLAGSPSSRFLQPRTPVPGASARGTGSPSGRCHPSPSRRVELFRNDPHANIGTLAASRRSTAVRSLCPPPAYQRLARLTGPRSASARGVFARLPGCAWCPRQRPKGEGGLVARQSGFYRLVASVQGAERRGGPRGYSRAGERWRRRPRQRAYANAACFYYSWIRWAPIGSHLGSRLGSLATTGL